MSDLSFGDRIVALVIAVVCVGMMVGARVLLTAHGGSPAETAHAYIP